ncbi:MAG: (d)CMP kinase, partial [Propionibacterium sp.]|nr:(d)CMP kinase [Propionibacterium sp.]
MVIAVDGPSGAGKSSTTREVAAPLGGGDQDTRSMYRA